MSFRFLAFITIILALLIPFYTNAQEAEHTARWYRVYWNNILIADFKAEINGDKMSSDIESLGTVRAISKYSLVSETTFKKSGNKYLPVTHSSMLTQRQGDKKIKINYDAVGNIKDESVVPPDKRFKRPAVLEESKKGVPDPLTAALIAREKIREAMQKGETSFSFNVYEGRRLARLDFNIINESMIKVLDKNREVLKINFRRVPLEGFTKNELKRMKGEEPDFVVYLDKEDLIPVKADAAAPLGKASFKMVKECGSITECK